jgi:uncharacterized protein YukE
MYEHVTDPATKRRHAQGVAQLSSTLPQISANTLEAQGLQTLQSTQLQLAQQARADAKVIESLRAQLEEANAALRRSQEECVRVSAGLLAREAELARLTKIDGERRLITSRYARMHSIFLLTTVP